MGGQSDLVIICRQILPNAMAPIIVSASLMIATAILMESAISFLGLGDPDLMSWGYQVGAARTVIRQAWWLSFFPGLAIVITTVSATILAAWARIATDPGQRWRLTVPQKRLSTFTKSGKRL